MRVDDVENVKDEEEREVLRNIEGLYRVTQETSTRKCMRKHQVDVYLYII